MSKKNKTNLAIVAAGAAAIVAGAAMAAPETSGSNGGPTIEEEIQEWVNRAQAVEADFHPLCIKVLKRVMETQNATLALQLQNGMPKIMRKREFAAWLAKYSPINLRDEDEKTSNFKSCRLRKENGEEHSDKKLYRPWNIEGAEANPFFEKKEEVKALDPSTMDHVKRLVTDMTSLAKTIMGTGKKPLASGVSLEEAQKKLKSLKGMHTLLKNGKMTGELPGTTAELVNKALAYVPEEKAA